MVKNVPPVKKPNNMEKLSFKMTQWIGTPASLIIHTLIFIGIPCLSFFGLEFRTVSLLLTTWLSMEAIYLAIFIQMTVNRHTEIIEDIEEDIDDIQEDVEDIQEDVEELSGEIEDEDPKDKSRIKKILHL